MMKLNMFGKLAVMITSYVVVVSESLAVDLTSHNTALTSVDTREGHEHASMAQLNASSVDPRQDQELGGLLAQTEADAEQYFDGDANGLKTKAFATEVMVLVDAVNLAL